MSVQDRLAFDRAVPSTTWAGIGMSGALSSNFTWDQTSLGSMEPKGKVSVKPPWGMSSDSTQACIRLSALLPDEPSDHLLLEKIELEFSRLVGERVE